MSSGGMARKCLMMSRLMVVGLPGNCQSLLVMPAWMARALVFRDMPAWMARAVASSSFMCL